MQRILVDKDYLSGRRWQRMRRIVLERHSYRCAVCNSYVDVEVHHRSYQNVGTEKEIDDLVALCAFCHALYHKKLIIRILRYLWRLICALTRRKKTQSARVSAR